MGREELLTVLRAHAGEFADYAVQSLYLFGSAARNETRPDSDVDSLVQFRPYARVGLFHCARLRRRLSELVHAPVDLVLADALHAALRENIMRDAVRAA